MRDETPAETRQRFLRDNPDWMAHTDIMDNLSKPDDSVDAEVRANWWECMNFQGIPIARGLLYTKLVRDGNSPRFAAMAAMQRTPGAMTDDVFFGGRPHFSEVCGERYANEVKQKLASQGVTLGDGDDYVPALARFKGDPEAVIGRTRGRGYIRQLCESRGWACEGAVNVESQAPTADLLAPEHCVRLRETTVREKATQLRKEKPQMSWGEAREAVIAKHGFNF